MCPTLVFIPGHKLTVVASDGMPIQSQTVDILSVITGERYDFIVNFNDMSERIPLFVVFAENLTIFQTALVVTPTHLSFPLAMEKAIIHHQEITCRTGCANFLKMDSVF